MTYYVDTNIWIYAMIAHPRYGERCKEILSKIEAEELEAAISTQVLGEIAGVLYSKYKVKDTTSQLNAVLSYPMDVYIIHPDAIRVAAEYSRDYNITPYDGIHIAVAVENNISEMISADKELDKTDLIRRIDPIEFDLAS